MPKSGKKKIYRPTLGKGILDDIINENRIRTISFAVSRDMIIKSTFFKHKKTHKGTWIKIS